MAKIIISADSTIDMPPEFITSYGIQIIPSYVSLGDQEYDDYPDITMQDLFGYFDKTGKLPQTAAANPQDYIEHFRKLSEGGNAVIHISKSSGSSSCWKNADLAAHEFENIYAIDSESLAGGSGLLCKEAVDCGITDPKALAEHLDEYKKRIDGSFIIETLKYLREGGRCSSVALLGANILKLRPEIQLTDGVMHVTRKFRGKYERCIEEYLETHLADLDKYEDSLCMLSHTIQNPELIEFAKNVIRRKNYFKEIMEYHCGSAVACHCGPNTFGAFFIRKK